MVEDYKDRLARAMKEAGVGTTQLADALHISYQAVRKVLLGGQFGTENNAAAAKRLRVRSDWLATGKGPMRGDLAPASQEREWLSESLKRKVLLLSDEELRGLERIVAAAIDFRHIKVSAVPNAKQFDTVEHAANAHTPAPEDGLGLPDDLTLPGPQQHGRQKHQRPAQRKGRSRP